MMKDSWTKSDLMEALNKIKTPLQIETEAERQLDRCFGGPGIRMNDTLPIRCALAGAELLIQVLTEGRDQREARGALLDTAVRAKFSWMIGDAGDPVKAAEEAMAAEGEV